MQDEIQIDWYDTVDYITKSIIAKTPLPPNEDDIRSAAFEGAWKAFLKFDPKKSKDIHKHTRIKGYHNTIDILRKEKLMFRTDWGHTGRLVYNFSDIDIISSLTNSDEKSFIENDKNAKHYNRNSFENFDKFWFELTDGLESDYLEVLYLRYVEKRTFTEMIKKMKSSHKNIERLIFDARKRMCELHGVSDENIFLNMHPNKKKKILQ